MSQGTFGVLRPGSQSWTPQAFKHSLRDPVPGKLRGKADLCKGSFIVMHLAGTKKAPEDTTPNVARTPAEPAAVSTRSSRQRITLQSNRTASPQPSQLQRLSSSAPGSRGQARPKSTSSLTALETKKEQARLLTLLRSLNPVTVVDQICTAVAFFGGIPGAPPPEAGAGGFPESARANGSGSSFVGWVAEIFPSIDGTNLLDPLPPAHGPPAVDRRATWHHQAAGSANDNAGPSESLSNAHSRSSQVAEQGVNHLENRPRAQQRTHDSAARGSNASSQVGQATEERASVVDDGQAVVEPSMTSTVDGRPPTSKKRGRPKGSRNKPKATTSWDVTAAAAARRSGPGRPKGSRNKPKPRVIVEQSSTDQGSTEQGPAAEQGSADVPGHVDALPKVDARVRAGPSSLNELATLLPPVPVAVMGVQKRPGRDLMSLQPSLGPEPSQPIPKRRKRNDGSQFNKV